MINDYEEIQMILQKLRQEKPMNRQEEILYLINVHGYSQEEAEAIIDTIEKDKPGIRIE